MFPIGSTIRMEKPDIEPPLTWRGELIGQIFRNILRCEALSVDYSLQLLDLDTLGFTCPEDMNVLRHLKTKGSFHRTILSIVVALYDEHTNVRSLKFLHFFAEP